jgi:WD40 repeat protein/tRNA A-37 threonylcarbamoyl transferase component Bud32
MCPDSAPNPGETPRTRDFRADDSLSLEALQRIDQICLAFENAWQAGTPPELEQFLGATAEPERSVLLGELVRLELEYLSRRGEIPAVEQYQARFPDHRALIAELFEEHVACAGRVRPPGTRVRYFGDYEILEEISQGGMGIVYKARQLSLNRVVALKMIRSGQLASWHEVERFHREAEAAANLQHPNIVAIHEVGEHEGQHYFSMDFVDGHSLAELIEGNPQPALQSASYVRTIAQAIEYAHVRGVLHRDLKPANVLIDATGQPRVTDFGLAKRMEADSGLTHSREILGTPSYMPPEQAAGHWADVGPPSDVYSLGAILYELLTGRPPFCGETATDTLSQVLHDEPIAPRRLNPKVPRDLETVALKCLEKERAKRYPTAAALADDLGRYLEDRPILARPISRTQRLWRWCKRNRTVAAFGTLAAALSLFLAVAGPLAAWYQASLLYDKSVALDEAQFQRTRAEMGERTAKEETEKAVRARQDAEEARRQTRRTLYVAAVNLISFHWELGNIDEVQRLLDEQRPSGNEEDLREFVWHYWSHRLQNRQTTRPIPSPMPAAVNTVVSPDGRWIAFAGTSGKVHVRRWDALPDTADEFVLTVPGRFPSILGVAFLPDGETIAVRGALDVILWSLPPQPAILDVLTLGICTESTLGHSTFSSNGRYLTVTKKSECEVWDLTQRHTIAKIAFPDQPQLRHFCVSDDGDKLVTNTGTVWNLKENRAEYSVPLELTMDHVAFSPVGEGFVTLGFARRLSHWDRDGRERVLAERATVFATSPARKEVCWATVRNVQVLRLDGSAQPRTFPYRNIVALRYDSNGRDLLALDRGHLYRLPLDSTDPDAPVVLFAEQRGANPGVLSAMGSWYTALVCGDDPSLVHGDDAALVPGEVCVWASASGRLVSRFRASKMLRPSAGYVVDGGVRALAVGENCQVATCSPLGDVEVWNGLTGQHLETLVQSGWAANVAEGLQRGLWAVVANCDVSVVAAMRLDGTVVVWNRAAKSDGKLPAATHLTFPLVISPDGTYLRTMGKSGGTTVWDLSKLEAVAGARDWYQLFSFGSRWAYPSVSPEGRIDIVDFESGETTKRLGVHSGLMAIAATPDTKNIATLSSDGTLVIWDARFSAPLLTVEGSLDPTFLQSLISRADFDTRAARLAFVDDGHALALFQHNGRVRYWRVRPPADPPPDRPGS